MNVIHLNASDLFSKFGFNDGELIGDWLFDNYEQISDVDDRAVLVYLVRRYLLPKLADHTFTVDELVTNHNPIRVGEWEGAVWDDRSGAVPEVVADVSVTFPGSYVFEAIDSIGEGKS